ncbi:uncharacterized protein LOC132804289 [Ziziphus jujuba]|uniref:Uncharacterized protein LOC132804289 n=1 Tax=Ziziphus jujuba TaxID=326968 RepID=A0ABM4ACJ3_ZIZJJ|nr:uncharacterized protein LOC132804289 [Ziziphus jujuba]
MGGYNLVFLRDEKLRHLAELLYKKEALNMQNMHFSSEPDRVKYLRDCKTNYESVMKLLDQVGKLKGRFLNDTVRAPIAGDILSYTETFINNALQTVRNLTLRKQHLDKITDHVRSLVASMENMDPQNETHVERVGKEVEDYNKAMLAYNTTTKSGTPGVKELSKMLMANNVSFEKLVQTFEGKLDIGGKLKEVKDVEKKKVMKRGCGSCLCSSGVSPPLSTDGLQCYVASLPDGAALARQIAHH